MALKRKEKVYSVEVVNAQQGSYIIEVKTSTTVWDGDEQVGRPSFSTHFINPETDLSSEDAIVKKIAEALLDEDVKKSYKDKK